ncbi:MAG TPA: FAD-dependent oxidoreductase, partial [Verrucomicrobiae bacterium]|nr:FAD-dependent oxidoreductase [Verrucomicrobiae bacterium]
MPENTTRPPITKKSFDACVYGSTPGGVAAAIEAARRGCRVVLACPKAHPGGMTASGLCTTDAVRTELFGGLVAEFVALVRSQYDKILPEQSPDRALTRNGWFYEPSVAEAAFEQMLAAESDRLDFWRQHHLVDTQVQNGRLTRATFVSAKNERVEVEARTFIDATYEGDLAASAKVPYRVGREGRAEFGESKAGIHYMNWRTGEQIQTPDTGEPSPAIQAFCARSIFTDDSEQLVPIEKPATYEEHLPDLLPLLEDFKSGRLKNFSYGAKLPRRKYELNGSITALTSSNCPGISWNWPEANREHRQRLERFHIDHVASMIWFFQNQPGVPDHVAQLWRKTGLHRAEFKTTG